MAENKKIAIIPARMGATRFPGKPLAKILDLPMIEHVRRRVSLCDIIDEVYVATCDKEIFDVVKKYNGNAIMTSHAHERCTDRVKEAAGNIDADIVVIFQGDEPLFFPEVASSLIDPLLKEDKVLCSNLLSIIKSREEVNERSIVKTLINHKKYVIYFSRSAIPYFRGDQSSMPYRQTGLSAFRKTFLNEFSKMTPTPLETAESIDFLRILEHGFSIRGVVYNQTLVGVDEPEHIPVVEEILKQDPDQSRIYKEILAL
jgi:3-deoxy-manno-octulosonate cytidylyltransferase (CMP-KDO synthetase)